jgi:hypothetical protein
VKLRLFQNQRNAYICGFALLLWIVLFRFRALMQKLITLEEDQTSNSASSASSSNKKQD